MIIVMMIAIRKNANSREEDEFVYKHMCAQTQRSHKLRLPKDLLDVFAYTREIRTVI